MKLNRLEIAGLIASLALVILAAVFCVAQTAYAQSVDPCTVPGMVMFGCDDEGEIAVPVDPCDIASCDEEGSMAEDINCEIYDQLVAAGDPIPQDFDASGCEDSDTDTGTDEGGSDVCRDEGMQTETPCTSDGDGGGSDNDEEGAETDPGTGSDSGSGGGGSSGGSGSGGGGSGGGGSSGGGSGGSVLGASTSNPLACEYLTGFIKEGAANDFEQVARLQAFLKVFEGANVEVSGDYDAASVAAVRAFQLKYSTDILAPWDISHSTGYVYLTTRKKINEIYCDRGTTFPLTATEQQVIETTKAVAASAPAPQAQEEQPTEEPVAADESPEEDSGGVVNRPGNTITNFFRRLFDWLR